MDKIGPTFGDELAAAGVAGLPFSWGADGTFSPADLSNITPEQKEKVLAVLAAHDPNKVPPYMKNSAIDEAEAE